jgi:hypothetical protein
VRTSLRQLKVRVEVGKQGREGNVFENQPGSSINVHVTRPKDGSPPKAVVRLANPPISLARSLRDEEGDNFLRVSAGFGSRVGDLFVGAPMRDGIEYTAGADWELKITAISGGDRYRSIMPPGEFSGGSFREQVIKAIIATGATVGHLDLSGAPSGAGRRIRHSGPAFRLLERMARIARAQMVYDGNEISFVRFGRGIPQGKELVPVFSTEEGNLLGEVTFTKDGVKAQVILEHTLKPGKQFVLKYFDPFEARVSALNCVARDVSHMVDTAGDAAYTNLLGRLRTNV